MFAFCTAISGIPALAACLAFLAPGANNPTKLSPVSSSSPHSSSDGSCPSGVFVIFVIMSE